ncbi:MAG: ParA family protein [Succinivibrio sp.]
MAIITAICNPKGGTAKTSTAVNLCCALSCINKKVLLVDYDPQRSAGCSLGFEISDVEHNLASCILDGISAEKCVVPYTKGGFDILLSSDDLIAVPSSFNDRSDAHLCLLNSLKPLVNSYDHIIIDTPASHNLLLVSSLCAADFLIIPVSLDVFALNSMSSLMTLFEKLKIEGKSTGRILGVLRTLYDPMQPLSEGISKELEKNFGDLLFKTKITYNPKISESSSAACPVLIYDRSSVGSREYLSLCAEFLKRIMIRQ